MRKAGNKSPLDPRFPHCEAQRNCRLAAHEQAGPWHMPGHGYGAGIGPRLPPRIRPNPVALVTSLLPLRGYELGKPYGSQEISQAGLMIAYDRTQEKAPSRSQGRLRSDRV
jgi:hypothetical protein